MSGSCPSETTSSSAPPIGPLLAAPGEVSDLITSREGHMSSPSLSNIDLPGASSFGNAVTATRPRGHSTSTIRGPKSLSTVPSLASMSSSMMTMPPVHAVPMERPASEPLPPSISSNRRGAPQVTFPSLPPSAASTVSGSSLSHSQLHRERRASSRGRAVSLSRDRSAGTGTGSDEIGHGRSRSPFREFALSWSSLGRRSRGSGVRTPSSVGSDSRADSVDIMLEGDEEDMSESGRERLWASRSSWWRSHSPRFWSDRDKRKDSMTAEQVQGLMRVQERVRQATASLLPSKETMRETADMASEVVHEALALSADVLQFAPVVGLGEAARVLVNIWDAVQAVDINRLACLRLTERCASILISVREEIEEMDRMVQRSPRSTPSTPPVLTSQHQESPGKQSHSFPGSPGSPRQGLKPLSRSPHKFSPLSSADGFHANEETPRVHEGQKELSGDGESASEANRKALGHALAAPMEKLISSFNNILGILEKQNRRPFIKRYLKREEIRQELLWCDGLLSDAMSLFDVRVLFRIYTQLMLAEDQRQADNAALREQLLHTSPIGVPSPILPPYQSREDFNALHLENVSSSGESSAGLNALGLDLQTPGAASQETVPEKLSVAELLSRISHYTALQNEQDFSRDATYLRQVLSSALATNDDMEMIRMLQVSREEMPEALKALQRALEVEVDRERDEPLLPGEESVHSMQAIMDGVLGQKIQGKAEPAEHDNTQRQDTSGSSHSRTSTTSWSSTSNSRSSRDTLDREFLESGIDSLRRLSIRDGQTPSSLALPPWTITRYEVDRDEEVGMGSFSEVWRGRYKGMTVAVKILVPWTPKEAFMREVLVWRKLRHRNVLGLIGASAVDVREHARHRTGRHEAREEDNEGPWFFVSRYYPRGSLVKWVKGLERDAWESLLDDAGKGVLRMVHEISKGMAYLHLQEILHGDLKCANVLIDDDGHCIISDFGESEMKSEAYRIGGREKPHGTLHWQAPELMAGRSQITRQTDVYAFAISCVEILNKGAGPWPSGADDEAVRDLVLNQDARPELPTLRPWGSALANIVRQSWDQDPASRPSFAVIKSRMKAIRKEFGWDGRSDPVTHTDLLATYKKSPNMVPSSDLPSLPPDMTCVDCPPFPMNETTPKPQISQIVPDPSPGTANASVLAPISIPSDVTPGPSGSYSPDPQMQPISSRSSIDHVGVPESPIPTDEAAAEIRNEQRYRMWLQHEYHTSLSLPLWTPSPVALGAVGYHSKPAGTFVTLLNAFRPMESSFGRANDMPSLYGFGDVFLGSQKSDKRSMVQRGVGRIQGWISRGKSHEASRSVTRRYSAPLRTGHKAAHLFTETTIYRYVTDLDTPKRWFHANVDQLLLLYGQEHSIQKEDLILVIGTLDAAEHALFVSHDHPDGQVDFNVFSAAKVGQTWGQFSTTTDTPASVLGPVYHEDVPGFKSANKVSLVKKASEPWDTVLLARLRFPPDRVEPTSL